MLRLNYPPYDFPVRHDGARSLILDPIRRKYVPLTAEEWVRQHLIRYLTDELGVPGGLIGVEHALRYQGMARRADVVVYGRDGRPVVMAECKAPDVEIRQDVFDQAARYNRVLRAAYLVVTNGLVHYCCRIDHEQGTYAFLDDLPRYERLQAS